MRIVFMGTPAFAATCLAAIGEHEIVGVFTKPDAERNRGMKLSGSEVKLLAQEKGYPVYQPTTFKDDAAYEQLCALQPDLIAVVAYGKILPQRVLDIPKYGCINIHGSILPQLRGAAPVQWAVLNGLSRTGVSAMYLSVGMDEGDVIEIRKTPIGKDESAGELMDRLSHIGAELLCDTIESIENGTATRMPQNNAEATYAPMLTRELSPINWQEDAERIVCRIHGLNPWPVATTELCGTALKIFDARAVPGATGKAPGTPVELTKQGLLVACKNGAVLLTRLQASGGKQMNAADYFRGHPIKL